MLVLRKLVRELKAHTSYLVYSFDHIFQQLLEGGELSIQNSTVEIALHMMQVSICSGQEMLVGNQNQSLLLDIDSFFVPFLRNVGT